MMSAKSMSAMIRAKKKKMEDDESGAVKLSGIPEDATDIAVEKNKEYGEMLSDNIPKDHDEDPSIESEMSQEKMAEPHEEMAPDPHQINQDMDPEDKQKRYAKIRSMMGKMGK